MTTIRVGLIRTMQATIGFAVLVLLGQQASGQTHPAGPVQMIVPYAREGSADILARMLAGELAKQLAQPVSVENRPGGGGGVGLQSMVSAAPDGRTLLLGQTGEIVVQPFFLKLSGPRPTPVALVAQIPLAVVVSAKAPFAKLSDLVEVARSAPRGLSIASPGRLTPGDLAIELFRNKTSGRIASVPFDGGGPALDAVADGVIDVYFSTLTSAMPYLRAGKIKILAVTSAGRSPALPDIPTMQESGMSRFLVVQWAGIFVPRATPAALVAQLNHDINETLGKPEVTARIVQDGGKVTPLSPAEFAAFIRADAKVYQDLLTAELCSEFVVESCSGGGEFTR